MAPASAISFTLAFLALLCYSCSLADALPAALIVFGDSYADTGNHDPSVPALYAPWRPPYGETWPRRPSGRYSNGIVLTDAVARHLGLASPVPYRMIKASKMPQNVTGINFAFGGSGVFPTFGAEYPNVSVQILQFRETIAGGLFSNKLLPDSLALLVLAGNDYIAYDLQHPGDEGIEKFVPMVVAEMVVSLQALYDVGLRSFAVTTLEPLGCLPIWTSLTNYTSCSAPKNGFTALHNMLLATQMSQLQKKLPAAKFWTLDLEGAFNATLQSGELGWQPCCEAIGKAECGDLDSRGGRLYSVCSAPERSFFWDSAHPTQAGWDAVTKRLFSTSL